MWRQVHSLAAGMISGIVGLPAAFQTIVDTAATVDPVMLQAAIGR